MYNLCMRYNAYVCVYVCVYVCRLTDLMSFKSDKLISFAKISMCKIEWQKWLIRFP